MAIGSYGGGLLSGDVVELDVAVERDATLVLGTQASTKVYRVAESSVARRPGRSSTRRLPMEV